MNVIFIDKNHIHDNPVLIKEVEVLLLAVALAALLHVVVVLVGWPYSSL
jgi:hypothetical protein